MKKTYKLAALLTIVITFVSCTNSQQQNANNLATLDKKSSREVSLKSTVVGDSIYHITSQKVWANGQLIIEKTDTIKTVKEVPGWNGEAPTTLEKAPIYVTVE
ncbi:MULTISPECIES: hypothetical protein [Myroides]|uniref:Uncharacterized protein n=1 Tax=Myroides albus TaxID=2562892 RepID=A0A6I3LGJ7_9FLAO|nr:MULTISPECIES: hypothetical protein [Myroides]MTG96924.1 hypothetical protein [Myroides albus]MVX35383.1 hypothetical protein [Myroides sp. LoEW2-1]UVD78325.1 hypothetical protein NWE55_09260 [Myroides albus]